MIGKAPAIMARLYLISLFLLLTTPLHAHPGGVDNNGGHVNRTTLEYHCHQVDCLLPTVATPEVDGTTIASPDTGGATTAPPDTSQLDIISFNIQFLANFKNRDDTALAELLTPFDIVVIQELVAPPFEGTFPDGTPYRPDIEAQRFFDAMKANGFDFVLSEEDTGTNDTSHVNSASTEWWVTFYKPELVEPATDLPTGFLAEDRYDHPDYERVPYATPFRTKAGGNDFVLISVHLKPGDSKANKKRRQHELKTIARWIDANDTIEQDFFILGDMNFKNCAEVSEITPAAFIALNTGNDCVNTNTNLNGPRPYDNVLLPNVSTNGLSEGGGFTVIDLIEAMRAEWIKDFATEPYPGDPYDHNAFRARYSDHHPVHFQLLIGSDDD